MCLECTATQHMLIAVEANTSDEAFKAFGVQERLMPAEWAMRNTSYLNRMSFCIRHVPGPWKSNSTVQRGRRRHVQEASGRWRTRLAGKEKEILFSSKKAIPQKPQEVSRILRCRDWIHERSTRLCIARSAFLHLEFGEGSHDFTTQEPCSHAVFSLYCLARS